MGDATLDETHLGLASILPRPNIAMGQSHSTSAWIASRGNEKSKTTESDSTKMIAFRCGVEPSSQEPRKEGLNTDESDTNWGRRNPRTVSPGNSCAQDPTKAGPTRKEARKDDLTPCAFTARRPNGWRAQKKIGYDHKNAEKLIASAFTGSRRSHRQDRIES